MKKCYLKPGYVIEPWGSVDPEVITLSFNQEGNQNGILVRIGDIAFAGLPGEIFNEFGKENKVKSPCKNTIVTGRTNYGMAFLPTAVSFIQDPKGLTSYITGYDTTPGSTLYEIGSGEKLAESAINQLNRLCN